MEIPLSEGQKRFEEALKAIARGEQVVFTEGGEPVAKMLPLREPQKRGFDFERARRISKRMGFGQFNTDELWPPEFDDPEFGRKVLRLE